MPLRVDLKIPAGVEVVIAASLIRDVDGRWGVKISGRNLVREDSASLGSYLTRREAFEILIHSMRTIYADDADDASRDISGIPGIPSPTEGNA